MHKMYRLSADNSGQQFTVMLLRECYYNVTDEVSHDASYNNTLYGRIHTLQLLL